MKAALAVETMNKVTAAAASRRKILPILTPTRLFDDWEASLPEPNLKLKTQSQEVLLRLSSPERCQALLDTG